MNTTIHNRMGNFIFQHLEEGVGTLAGLCAYWHLDSLLAIPMFSDAMFEITFKFLVAVVCGVGGGIGGLAVKSVVALVKKKLKG